MKLTLREAHELPLQEKLGRIVLAGLTLAVAIWLGYAFGRGQSLGDIARLYRDQDKLDFTIDTGKLVALFARTGGDLKPLLRAPDGTLLIDYSDWDYSAVVIADGERFEFVRLVPSASVDYGHNRIVEGLDSGSWVLSREITLNGADADVRFTFVTRKVLHDVRVYVAHDAWYFQSVTPAPDGFTATVPHASRQEVESGAIRTPAYEVKVAASAPTALLKDLVRVDLATSYGVQSVSTAYELKDPPVGQYVPLAREHVTWRKL